MKIVFSLLFTLTLVNSSICGSLERADSLFANKKYTESFDIYKTIMEQEKQVSSAMLLKMAYIKEGLGNSTDALYYLNLYYLRTADKKVLEKLQSLAEKSGVEGYEFNDFEFFQTIFYKYFAQLLFLVGSLSVFMLALVYYMKIIKKWNPIFPAIIMVLSLTALFYTINFGRSYNKAIVMAPQVLLMSGPSSAAEVLASVEEGSRVTYTNTQDVWTKVAFDNKTGFIKTDKLRAITY